MVQNDGGPGPESMKISEKCAIDSVGLEPSLKAG